ncbi:hypothetical protein [Pseudarthrobacter polychromogenes]|uniref:Tail assembly chaperone n=1 Tax=Pseudarthrobacter polychromogenes TaxID=1676 RepID=A0ABQ1XAU7_9MICC|nr:hypothetical protein [Pseudarthrobacter polychromogenes]GGG83587.1 hypothetical protein GCM10011577_01300 [Pseudarthrobacter polychromogenes]
MTTEEFNLDNWLDGIQRTERSVTLYGRPDLLADIDELEAQQRATADTPEEDRAAGESTGGKLQEKIDALYLALDASKLVFRVSFLDDQEQNAIEESAKSDMKTEADAAAAAARKEAREKCKRLEITQPNEINTIARNMANAAADKVIEREVSIRTIAAAVVSPRLSVEQVRKLYTKVGDSQIALLSRAYSRASVEAPQVTVPKSLKPSQTDETGISS